MKTVAVLGSGTMGSGIAQVSALAGYQVVLYDIAEPALAQARQDIAAGIEGGVKRGKTTVEQAAQARDAIQYTDSLPDAAAADLIIEAVPEKLELKQSLFRQLDELAPAETLFASNTSSLSINALAGATQRPDRFIGLHFFNPAHIMKLVEVIETDDTSAETLESALAYVERVGKEPVLCQDTPAFIVNRVARPFYGEALRLLGEGAATAAEIDELAQSIGFRMGPFRLIDLVGCDVNLAVTESVYEAFYQDPKYRPHPIQRRMVQSGRLGRKSGRGFYKYE